jgi:hypothetical protein
MATVTPQTKIEDLALSSRCKAKLNNLEIDTVADLAATDYAVLFDAVGHTLGVQILHVVTAAGLKPTLHSPDWTDNEWKSFVEGVVDEGIVDWKEVALAICGELNPPQVGTAIASNPSFQRHYAARSTMRAVMEWFYAQDGKCAVCGTRLFLEADHIKSKQEHLEDGLAVTDADRLDNMQLLCKRCNVVKRSSHVLGGLSFGPAQSVLMWILLAERPRSKDEFYRLCRAHGLTMASVRFDEAWAFALWLAKDGKYVID